MADEPVSMVDASLRATILDSLKKLNRDFGIAILYITHDLTTAYHVADDIMVLYRGKVVESGDVETVIRHPQHDYTKLLIDSIPWPDLNRKWGDPMDKRRRSDAVEKKARRIQNSDIRAHVNRARFFVLRGAGSVYDIAVYTLIPNARNMSPAGRCRNNRQ